MDHRIDYSPRGQTNSEPSLDNIDFSDEEDATEQEAIKLI